MAVNVKLGVDLGGFNSGINAAKAEVKTLDQQMKMIDATFKATGNAEQAMSQKTQTLNKQMDAQKRIATQAEQALKAMTNAGVDPASASYQRMAQELLKAQTGMMNTQVALNGLGDSAQEAASGADQLTNSVNGISKKISLDQVISGIDTIKSDLESAAKKAVQLGEAIWNNVMDSARLSDDILTQAGILDMTPEQYQRYKGVFNTIGEVTISEWAATKRKIEKAMVDPSSDQMDVFRMLGLTGMGGKGGNTEILNIADNWEDVFWQVGSELRKRVESGEMSSAMADVYGEALFGKKYSSMKNLLKLGQEGFEAALNKQNIISDEALEKDAALNDAVIKLQDSFNALKAEVSSGLAPALTDAANALDGVLGKVLEYLQTEEGKEMLQSLGDAVGKLFEDLGNIDPAKVVENFTSVFNSLVGGLQWIVANKDTLISALKAVVIGWGGLKLTGGILSIIKLIDGLRDLGVIGGGAAAATGATATGAGGGLMGALTSGLGKVLPGVQSRVSTNGGPIWDWLMHESPIGSVMQGTETWDQWWDRQNKEQAQRTETFGENWDPNSENANILMKNAKNTIMFWDKVWKQNSEANKWVLDDNYTSEELMQLISNDEPVPVVVEPTPEADSAGKIAEQVGTVVLPVEFQIRSDYVNLQQYILKQMGVGHANGLSYVPNEGLYHLHRGERVVPAREVASRSFSSNLYVENMNMGGGLSADALAAAIAGRNRRMMAGYGS